MSVGKIIETSRCGPVEVTEKLSKGRWLVKFLDGTIKKVTSKSLVDGRINNPNQPSVCGVGIVGEGFRATIAGKPTREYSVWHSMMVRCYSDKPRQPSYEGCTTSEEWKYFQNFALWCQSAIGFNMAWDLDKDLLVRGNKKYSEDTCVFLPKSINSSIARCVIYYDGMGVSFSNHIKRFNVQCFDLLSERVRTKSFVSEQDANNFYLQNKFNRLGYEYSKYKTLLDERACLKIEQILGN